MQQNKWMGAALLMVCFALVPMAVHGQAGETGKQAFGLEDQESLRITVYSDDLAVVRDTRRVHFDHGRTRLEFQGVSAKIMPQTIILYGDGYDFAEQNFDFELLTPENLLKHYVGRDVAVEKTTPGSGKFTVENAVLQSTGEEFVLDFGDRVEILSNSSFPEAIKLPGIPQDMKPEPTLSTLVTAEQPYTGSVDLTYMTEGLEWRAAYVAKIHPDETSLDLQGWINLKNETGTSFENVTLQLLAGEVNRARDVWDERILPPEYGDEEQVIITGSRIPLRLPDYYIYKIRYKTTLENKQEKKIKLLSASNVPITKNYYFFLDDYNYGEGPEPVSFEYAIENTKENNLGFPLPTGDVQVYIADGQGGTYYFGESRIANTPVSEDFKFGFEEVLGLTVEERLITEREETGQNPEGIEIDITTQTVEAVIKNPTGRSKTLTLYKFFYSELDFSILAENFVHKNYDAEIVFWEVDVPAGGQTTLRFTLETVDYD